MRVIWGHENQVKPFVLQMCDLEGEFTNCQTAAIIDKNGDMVAGVVFHNWNAGAQVLEVSAASLSRKWATRSVLRELFGYIFTHCQACVARTAEENTHVRRLWKAFGAKEYIIPRLRGREASEAIHLLTDDAWASSKFMRSANG